jgi:hypothetical protein
MVKKAFPELLEVGPENVDQTDFFCFMSKNKSEGH